MFSKITRPQGAAEIKHDGFRGLALFGNGSVQIVSPDGNPARRNQPDSACLDLPARIQHEQRLVWSTLAGAPPPAAA